MTIEEQLLEATAAISGVTAERDDLRATVEKLTVGAASELESLKVEAASKDAKLAELTAALEVAAKEVEGFKAMVAELEASKVNEYGLEYATDLRAHHNRIKAKFGGRMKRGQKLGEPRLLVESKKELDDYIKERQVAVGKTKSAWLRALMTLPMPSNKNGPVMFGKDLRKATYIARHAGAGGYSRVAENSKEYMITIGNLMGNVNAIADEANTMALALGNRDRQMKADMEQYVERTIRRIKAGRRS